MKYLEWFYNQFDYTFSPSHSTRNVVLETMASGKPVITVDKGAACDLVIDGKTGFVCTGNNPKIFAQKIEFLFKNQQIYNLMQNETRKYALEYNWNSINFKLISAYTDLINRYKSFPTKVGSKQKGLVSSHKESA